MSVDFERLRPQLFNTIQYQAKLLGPAGEVVVGMEREGVVVDLKELADIKLRMEILGGQLRDDLMDWTPREINWNSWVQLSEWLHEQGPYGLGLTPSPYCKKGEVPDEKISTDDRALEWLAANNPEHRGPINAIRKLRQVERMRRYANDWSGEVIRHDDGTARLHPTFGLASDNDTRAGARTGRFGVKNPALNQVPSNPRHDPAGIKTAFTAPPGHRLICIDYSQLEVVINAHIIATLFGDNDPLVQRVRAGQDIHGPAARYIFGDLAGNAEISSAIIEMRQKEDGTFKEYNEFKIKPHLKSLRDLGKIGIYGKNYGKGVNGFAWSTFLEDRDGNITEPLGIDRASLLCKGLDKFYPGVPKYQEFVREFIRQYKYIVTLFGRWFPLPDASSNNVGLRNRAWRQALNYPMQGGGQEIMMLAIILMFNDPLLRKLGFKLVLVVHDEIIAYAPEQYADEALARAQEIMINCVEMTTPLRAEGHHDINWKKAKQ